MRFMMKLEWKSGKIIDGLKSLWGQCLREIRGLEIIYLKKKLDSVEDCTCDSRPSPSILQRKS